MKTQESIAQDQLCTITFTVNGRQVSLDVDPLISLADVLRDHLGLRGTKIGCNDGECGACTVIMDGKPVSSCLVLAPQVEGSTILTIEGVEADPALARIQQSFLDHGAVQCGYCTPGMILSAVALLSKNQHPTEQEIRTAITGNICRCTGYQKIVEAIQSYVIAEDREGVVPR